jgi:hypothetical protein
LAKDPTAWVLSKCWVDWNLPGVCPLGTDATRTIRQARRRANAQPNAKLRDVMELWARQEGLRIEC